MKCQLQVLIHDGYVEVLPAIEEKGFDPECPRGDSFCSDEFMDDGIQRAVQDFIRRAAVVGFKVKFSCLEVQDCR